MQINRSFVWLCCQSNSGQNCGCQPSHSGRWAWWHNHLCQMGPQIPVKCWENSSLLRPVVWDDPGSPSTTCHPHSKEAGKMPLSLYVCVFSVPLERHRQLELYFLYALLYSSIHPNHTYSTYLYSQENFEKETFSFWISFPGLLAYLLQ